ncbi:hypothetical protein GGR54DRAFT_642587 [Hypoxylon sp. NC1633]|nr:hypothetical protein GGR54DRAFT_642587 [Hypoxylon sp. NC1633]
MLNGLLWMAAFAATMVNIGGYFSLISPFTSSEDQNLPKIYQCSGNATWDQGKYLVTLVTIEEDYPKGISLQAGKGFGYTLGDLVVYVRIVRGELLFDSADISPALTYVDKLCGSQGLGYVYIKELGVFVGRERVTNAVSTDRNWRLLFRPNDI